MLHVTIRVFVFSGEPSSLFCGPGNQIQDCRQLGKCSAAEPHLQAQPPENPFHLHLPASPRATEVQFSKMEKCWVLPLHQSRVAFLFREHFAMSGDT